jgi:hypothetical protein
MTLFMPAAAISSCHESFYSIVVGASSTLSFILWIVRLSRIQPRFSKNSSNISAMRANHREYSVLCSFASGAIGFLEVSESSFSQERRDFCVFGFLTPKPQTPEYWGEGSSFSKRSSGLMADDAIQPGPPQSPPVDTGLRPGAPGNPGDIVLSSRVPAAPPSVEKPPEVKDPWRDIVETVVFVVVLVFMLKTFLAEAFVIPTGSMATTLLGDHKVFACEQCAYEYRINGSQFTQPQKDGEGQPIETSDCPNCGFINQVGERKR